jgi:hypothetical protein
LNEDFLKSIAFKLRLLQLLQMFCLPYPSGACVLIYAQ